MIFFDLDGTLLNSNGLWLQIDLDFLGTRGLAPTEEYSAAVARSIFPVAAQFTKDYYHLPDSPQAIMEQWQAMAREAYAHTLPLKEGALELLEKNRQAGRDMALLTASLPDLCRAALGRHGLEGYFRGLFFAQETGLEKWDPEVYRLAAEQFGVCPGDCVLIEDSPDNCRAAALAGFTVIGVYDDLYAGRWEEIRANSHRAVQSLTELL